MDYELVRTPNCKACDQAALVRKYGKLLRDREAQSRLEKKR